MYSTGKETIDLWKFGTGAIGSFKGTRNQMIYDNVEDGLHSVMFPVREVNVYAETEPGKRDRIPGKKALINDDTCRVLPS